MANAKVIDETGAEIQDDNKVIVMPRARFVDATKTVDLPISDGDYITIKAKLSFGEQKRLETAGFRSMIRQDNGSEQTELGLDWAKFELARFEAWLESWTLRDRRGKPMDVNRKNIENLDPDTAEEIKLALDAYIEEQTTLKNSAAKARQNGDD